MKNKAFSIYNASAGSGKTFTLVKEYLKILLLSPTDEAYKKILAITFTNKAVEEMKSRIVKNLSEFSKDEPENKAASLMLLISQETKLSLATIKDKSKAIIKNIIHNYASFDISTIDKFTHKVIRAFAHDLNLSVSFDVSLETDNLLHEAVDAIIAKAGEDNVLTKLLVDFSLDKTDNDKSWDITYELLEIGKLLTNENHRTEVSQFQDKTIEEFQDIKKRLKQAIEEKEQECIFLANSISGLMEEKGVDLKSFSAGHFPNHIGYIQKNELKASHKKYYAPEDVKINKTAKDRDTIESILPEILSTLNQVYKNYEKKNFYTAILKNITPLSLLNSISLELQRIQKEQNILSISEFNTIIYKEIQNQPAPFIYERLGERYKHFFIDEFQDTSVMQWQNLIPLIDNALASEDLSGSRGSLMIVGDPKQSIYRWRGGRAEQFIDLTKNNNPFSNPDKQLFTLDKNYRSFNNIINFNNSFFKMLAQEFENEDYKNLYEKNTQEINTQEGGYINISFLPELPDTEENQDIDRQSLYLEATLNTINQVRQRGFNYKDIVLLTRKRGPGVALANYLTENKIPILSSETLLIENAAEVKLIINLLRYLKTNENKEAKANFLYFIANNKNTGFLLHDFIEAGMQQNTEAEFEHWLQQQGYSVSFNNYRKKSLYEVVEIIVSEFIKEKSNQSYIQYFLDLVLERDIKTQAGISDFLEYWDSNPAKFSIPSPEGNDAVRIMTIHKSKGLEFPVVIFPFAEEDYTKSPRNKIWLEVEDDSFNMARALVDSKQEILQYGENAAETFSNKSQEELLDNINILYVALTRAIEQLYIISGKNFTSKGELTKNMSSYFVKYLSNEKLFNNSVLEYEFGDTERRINNSKPPETQETIRVIADKFNPANIKIARREALMWGTHQLEAIEFGNVIHEILSLIKTPEDIPVALKKTIESGLITTDQKQEVEKMLYQIINHPELKVFFDGGIVYNEQNILKSGTRTMKPDRVVIKENKAFLLDYKTGSPLPKHQKQIEEYQKLLNEMGVTISKKTLVYISSSINIINL